MPVVDDVVIRRMEPEEFTAMRAVAVGAFDEEVIGTLLDELRASWVWHDDLSFVAELDGSIVGQVLYTSAILDAPERLVDVLVLAPVGIRSDLQGQGIGSRLIRESLAVVSQRPEPLVFVEGSPAYYPRFGFRRADELGFRKPSLRVPDRAFMVFPLDGYETWMTGTLVYPDAFWRTDSVGLR
jgi:putative acetyltransferase